jgi:hypothetical protein
MEIRILTAEDANEWWRLRLEALESDPEAFSASTDQHQRLSLEDVRNKLGAGAQDSLNGDSRLRQASIGKPAPRLAIKAGSGASTSPPRSARAESAASFSSSCWNAPALLMAWIKSISR